MIVNPPFNINDRVIPAALPRQDLEIKEGNLIISGTGNTETGKTTLTILRTNMMTHFKCYGKSNILLRIHKSSFDDNRSYT